MILMSPRLPAAFAARLQERYTLIGPIAGIEPSALPPEAREAKALITLGNHRTDDALMAALPSLGLILCYGTGFEGVDLGAAGRHGLVVTNAGDANAEAVAEFAMGLVLATGRKVVEGDRYIRAGRWSGNAMERLPLVPGLFGKRIGIYGLGEIGKRIATRAAAFGMSIGYYNRRAVADLPYAYHASLEELARWSDVLMVAVRASAETRHAVDARILEALGPQGLVVNISRGSVVDTEALCDALERRVIAGAALDVFENEPEVPERLRAQENAVLTPHIAAYAASAQSAQQQLVMANLEAFFAGRPLSSRVN
ncbi:2-hydroxyacid dehydrogenase [Roseomonas xinghualingensis]|uniref:2-hydroxyacid dehydrogenase n=1 Tax=Roseomonas xinghualingensis TaxID=2986475 RepID=UPI0021F1BBE3|nr:2-hydroxyacid dehydrogenase [Roseomonas sp. SXEYE001]MCV4208801.1 2-hydroxyacid dehydrogenase [Roseomonas sp. SXEYE001]